MTKTSARKFSEQSSLQNWRKARHFVDMSHHHVKGTGFRNDQAVPDAKQPHVNPHIDPRTLLRKETHGTTVVSEQPHAVQSNNMMLFVGVAVVVGLILYTGIGR